MAEKLRLVRRHVHVDRAIALAALAGEAQVERVLHFLALPAVVDDFAVHHLEQHARAAARGILFLARHHVGGAHRSAAFAPAGADADAAQRGAGEAVSVGGIGEMRFGLRRVVVGPEREDCR